MDKTEQAWLQQRARDNITQWVAVRMACIGCRREFVVARPLGADVRCPCCDDEMVDDE